MAKTRRVRCTAPLARLAPPKTAHPSAHFTLTLPPSPISQRKKRTHKPEVVDPTKKGEPKTFVFKRGKHGVRGKGGSGVGPCRLPHPSGAGARTRVNRTIGG